MDSYYRYPTSSCAVDSIDKITCERSKLRSLFLSSYCKGEQSPFSFSPSISRSRPSSTKNGSVDESTSNRGILFFFTFIGHFLFLAPDLLSFLPGILRQSPFLA
ncbi:hypothetical protein ACJIZ3_000118 [Penstemon smallii]|uniref:Uncharacterized protein n=1 Tax=Penstemon smallii TaxID=265156 RepID=A0ABD3R947_9LAMI